MPYWISDTLAGTPAFLWIFVGVGVPWALAVLPRADWRRRVEVLALAFALGSAILTAWMFALGTLGGALDQPLLRLDLILIGTAIAAGIGTALAWRKARRAPLDDQAALPPFAFDERLLIGLIVAALVVRWIVIAYWSFTAYDALWVYGYQARLYFHTGLIPESIGYYPQYIQLQYLFGQLAVGRIDDHAARASIIFIHLGSILAAYTLGSRLFSRRAGIYLAALWTLYPHSGEWSRAGDLEIPLAFLFTLAAAYFLTAWTSSNHQRRYAAIAGVVLGIGLWTKPTMGAFVWGIALLFAVSIIQVWRDSTGKRTLAGLINGVHGKIEIIVITGVCAAPLGGVWYIRNLLLGHPAVDFPPSYWLGLALRSGGEFGWWLVAGIILLLFALVYGKKRPSLLLIVLGAALVAFGVLPSLSEPRRMFGIEWIAFAAGVGLLGWALWRFANRVLTPEGCRIVGRVGLALGMALPYYITWFYSYSYHYRLQFAIVPLLITPTAVLLAAWANPQRMRGALRVVFVSSVIIIGIPGIISAIYDMNGGWDYLWTDKYPTDDARYRSGNAALMTVVDGLNVWKADHSGETLVVDAPGIDRLPFFFPMDTIRTAAPTQLRQVDDAVYFVWGAPETIGEYQAVGAPQNPVLGALGRVDLSRRAWGMDDGIFRYEVYEINTARRFDVQHPGGIPRDQVVIGDFARFAGYDLVGLELWPGRPFYITLAWEVFGAASTDYSIFVHLRDAEGNLIKAWDAPAAPTPLGYYSTQYWQAGEWIKDERLVRITAEELPPPGDGYSFWIGFYDTVTLERVPITLNGVEIVDDYLIDDRIVILERAPGT